MQTGSHCRNKTRVRSLSSKISRALGAIALLLVIHAVHGQGVSGRILGTVQDRSGAVVAKASVTVTNQGTNISVVSKTDSNGDYRIDNLQPGTSRVMFDAQGFHPYVSSWKHCERGWLDSRRR